jgi:superfamily I DNA/RNA helicase
LQKVARLWDSIIEGRAGDLWEALAQVRDSDDLLRKIHATLQEFLDTSGDSASLEEILVSIARHLHPWRKPADFLSEAGSWVEALSYANQSSQRVNVRLTTFQSAKGLEAKIVCVIGLEDGIIPRAEPGVDIAEQARLLFVSMTRAKNELHLFHARKRSSSVVQRNIYRTGAQPDLSRSEFLDAIDKRFLDPVYHRY